MCDTCGCNITHGNESLIKPGGKLVAIVGEEPAMSIELIVRNDPHYTRTKMIETVVPSLENIATSAEFSF